MVESLVYLNHGTVNPFSMSALDLEAFEISGGESYEDAWQIIPRMCWITIIVFSRMCTVSKEQMAISATDYNWLLKISKWRLLLNRPRSQASSNVSLRYRTLKNSSICWIPGTSIPRLQRSDWVKLKFKWNICSIFYFPRVNYLAARYSTWLFE